jgi:molybdopterin molybdotransferase
MAQLSDDCFAFGGPMMSIDEAVGIITARVTPVREIEIVSLIDADGRVLARDIAAPLPLPPFTNSAVDGYAVRSSDLPQGQEHGQEHGQKHGQQSRKEEQSKEAQGKDKRGNEQAFPIAGRAQAGGAVQAAQAGHAVRIFTGAPMPQGTDTVFMQEDVRIDESGRVILPPGLEAGANVRPAGEDVALGHVALRAGERLKPQHIALAAAFGLTELPVMRRIRVAVFSTGDELASPGTSRAAAQLFDSNRFMLTAMLRRLGAAVSDLGILRDERAPLARALSDAASAHDLLLTTGGVSTGEEDHVKAGVESVGSLVLWRMAIKPGRPVAMGIISGTPFVGLPGNPVASFVTFVHVVRPTVLALSGAAQRRLVPVPVRAAFSYKKKAGRREYVRVTLRNGADGALEAVKFPREGAGLLSSLVDTDGLVELGENVTKVEPGMRVGFLGYENLI